MTEPNNSEDNFVKNPQGDVYAHNGMAYKFHANSKYSKMLQRSKCLGILLGFSSMAVEDRQSKQSDLHMSFLCRAYLPSMGIDFTITMLLP